MNIYQLIQFIQQLRNREELERQKREWTAQQLGQNPRWKGVSDSGGMSLEQLFRMQRPNLTNRWDKNANDLDEIQWRQDRPYEGLLQPKRRKKGLSMKKKKGGGKGGKGC